MLNNLEYYTGFTLVDITATGETHDRDSLEYQQQSNWQSILRAISYHAQPIEISIPSRFENVDIDRFFQFGEFYQGTHTVWFWQWATEHSGAYAQGNSDTGGLAQLISEVPIYCGLSESARFMLPIFYPHGAIKNVYFESDRIINR